MNYLGHTILSFEDDQLLFGNLVADIVSNKEMRDFSPMMLEGVRLHRLIDSFTDNHPNVRVCTQILRKQHRKYAPVAFDLLADFFLATHWQKHCKKALNEVLSDAYHILNKYASFLTIQKQEKLQRMTSHDFLANAITMDRLEKTCLWMDKRTAFPSKFYMLTANTQEHYPELLNNFESFFTDLRLAVNAFKESLSLEVK